MSLPHQCRCAICGEVGVITPALINPFAIVPTGTSGDSAYASSRADELADRDIGMIDRAMIATCVHGYTRCMPCKFPPVVIESDGLPYPLTLD